MGDGRSLRPSQPDIRVHENVVAAEEDESEGRYDDRIAARAFPVARLRPEYDQWLRWLRYIQHTNQLTGRRRFRYDLIESRDLLLGLRNLSTSGTLRCRQNAASGPMAGRQWRMSKLHS
jgi:hypothetical protein